MLDDMLRLRPIRGRVDTDLVVLICGEQLGAVRRVEIGCEWMTAMINSDKQTFLIMLYVSYEN